MKPLPPPPVPGKTEAERFSNAVRKIFSAPKDTQHPTQQIKKQPK